MRILISGLLLAGVSVSISGCMSYVRTFDANNKQIGACIAYHSPFAFGASVQCSGYANGQTAPANSRISKPGN
jgi:hypothetical protein